MADVLSVAAVETTWCRRPIARRTCSTLRKEGSAFTVRRAMESSYALLLLVNTGRAARSFGA